MFHQATKRGLGSADSTSKLARRCGENQQRGTERRSSIVDYSSAILAFIRAQHGINGYAFLEGSSSRRATRRQDQRTRETVTREIAKREIPANEHRQAREELTSVQKGIIPKPVRFLPGTESTSRYGSNDNGPRGEINPAASSWDVPSSTGRLQVLAQYKVVDTAGIDERRIAFSSWNSTIAAEDTNDDIYSASSAYNLSAELRALEYRAHSTKLAAEAARKAVKTWQHGAARDITHVVSVTPSGWDEPGLASKVINALNLSPSTGKYDLAFNGCFAGLTGLRLAADIYRAHAANVSKIISRRGLTGEKPAFCLHPGGKKILHSVMSACESLHAGYVMQENFDVMAKYGNLATVSIFAVPTQE